ncbi:MAG: glycosyltransferase [Candidatus Sumerlaeaceae bacterium]|nr:glycosyltransferase [Candidatus Sumerlaeaceae bacterium]
MDEQVPECESALLVFLRYPEPGQVLLGLVESLGPVMACRLYAHLARRTLDEARRVAGVARYIFFDPPDRADEVDQWLEAYSDAFALAVQSDGDPGERMRAALHRIFSRNTVRRAVAVTAECPTLNRQAIESAFSALTRAPAVIGPTHDGGCYLLGMTRPIPFGFEDLDWVAGRVLEPMVVALRRRNLEPELLPVARRVETLDDLEAVWPRWRDEVGGG